MEEKAKSAVSINFVTMPVIGAACGAIAYNSLAGLGLGMLYGILLELVVVFGLIPVLGQLFSWCVWIPLVRGWLSNLSGMDFSSGIWLVADYIALAASILVSIMLIAFLLLKYSD